MPPRVRVDLTLSPLASAIVQHGLRAAGCRLVAGDECDLVWTAAPTMRDLRRASAHMRVSHVAGSEALTNKARLAATMAQARRRARLVEPDRPVADVPRTFSMPEELHDLKIAAAYDRRVRWLRRPKLAGTNQRPEPLPDVAAAGLDPRWIVQEAVDGTPIRVRALVSSIDPLTVDCWPPSGRRLSPDLWRAIELAIAAACGSAAAAMRAERVAVSLEPSAGFELLEFTFLAHRGTAHLIECAKWPHVKPAARLRDNPGPDDASDAAVRAALERLGLIAVRRASRRLVPLLPSSYIERLALIAAPTTLDISAARAAAAAAPSEADVLRPQSVHHYFLDDALVLFSQASETLSVLNPTASFVWLRTAEGASPPAVVQEAVDLFHGDPEKVAQDVWTALAGWIGGGLLAKHAPLPMAAAAPDPTDREHPHRRWNDGERVYEIEGRRICLRAPAGEIDRWLHATLDVYEQPAAASYHDLVELVIVRDRFALLINNTRTEGPFTARETPAAVHRRLRLLSLAARRCVLAMRATVVTPRVASDGAILLLNSAADVGDALVRALHDLPLQVQPRTPVRLCGDPLQLAGRGRSDSTAPLAAIVAIERALAPEASALLPLRRADALWRLMAEDPDAITALTPDATARLVHLLQHVDCWRLVIADEREAAGCILRACATLSA